MRFKRICVLPFALAADIVTLGNFGDRTYTQQVFDAELQEQHARQELEALRELIKLVDLTRRIE